MRKHLNVARPSDYRQVDDLEKYLKSRHGDCIILHPNARDTLRAGLFENSGHLIEMLELLGRPHHALKTGADDGKAYKDFHQKKEALHVKYGPVLSETSTGEYGHYYEVTWNGNRIDASDIGHIRDQGTTYAPERMAALYFYWDSERKTTVITSGPRKLPTPADGT